MSASSHRVHKIHRSNQHRRFNLRTVSNNRLQQIPEIRLDPERPRREMSAERQADFCLLHSLEEVYLVIQRKPMRSFPMPGWVKLGLQVCYTFMRWVNRKYGFAASEDGDTAKSGFHSIEIRVAHPNETDAWHDANCEGGAVKKVPWRAPLSDKTCQFGAEIWPALDGKTQRQYQDRKLEIISFTRSEWESLEAKAEQLVGSASA